MTNTLAWIGLLAPVATGILGWLFLKSRSTISYSVLSMTFAEGLTESGIIKDAHIWPFIGIYRIELRNKSIKHLTDISIYQDHLQENWVAQVSSAISISKEMVSFESRNNSLRIAIDELPRKEIIKIDVIQRGPSTYSGLMRGGGNRFRLVEANELLVGSILRVAGFTFVGALISLILTRTLDTFSAS